MAYGKRVEIPVGIKLDNVRSSLEEMRRLVDTGLKPNTKEWKGLNGILTNMEGKMKQLEVQAKGTFTSPNQIEQFTRKVHEMSANVALLGDKFSELSMDAFNIDTSKLDKLNQELAEMKAKMAELASDNIGNIFDNAAVGNLARRLNIELNQNVTFDGLRDGFNNAADMMRNRIVTLRQALGDLQINRRGLQSFDANDFRAQVGQSWTNASTSKTTLNSKDVTKRFLNDFISNPQIGMLESEFTHTESLDKAVNIDQFREGLRQSLINSANATINQLNVLFERNGRLNDSQQAKMDSMRRILAQAGDRTNGNLIDSITEQQMGGFRTNTTVNFNRIAQEAQQYMQAHGITATNRDMEVRLGETIDQYEDRIIQMIQDRLAENGQDITDTVQAIRQNRRDITEAEAAAAHVEDVKNGRHRAAENMQGPVERKEGQVNAEAAAVAEKGAKAQDNLTGSVDKTKHALEGAGKSAEDAADKYGLLARRTEALNHAQSAVKNFLGFQQVLNYTRRAVSDAIASIKELDSVMTEIAVVTNMSQKDLWGQIDTYTAIAKQYGVETKGVYEISMLYYQQGLNTRDAMAATTETLKMAKIAGLDYATATNYMTNAIRGFKMEMTDAQRVTDVYSALAASTASSTEELAVAMSKTASSAESVGASFEATSAMIATMVSVTRESATNIGSALKSIISRYGEMTTNPEKLVDEEGEALSLNKVDKALQSVGIKIHDAAGQFRNFDDVIYELAQKWDTLDSLSQRYIGTVMAGNRQQSRFLALVGNFDQYAEALETAKNAEDAGTLQTLKTLDSIESKLNQLKMTWQGFYSNTGFEEVWKVGLDLVTGIIERLNDLPKVFGKFPAAAIGVIFSIVSGFKGLVTQLLVGWSRFLSKVEQEAKTSGYKAGKNHQEGYDKGKKDAQNQNPENSNTEQVSTWEKVRGGIGAATSALGSFVSAMALASDKVDGLEKGVMSIAGTALSAAGQAITGNYIGAVITGISGIITAMDLLEEDTEERIARLKKEAEDVRNKALTSKNEYTNLNKATKKLQELADARYDSNDAYKEWLDYNNEIAEQYPQLIQYITTEGDQIINLSDAYKQLAIEKQKFTHDLREQIETEEELSITELNAAREKKELLTQQLTGQAATSDNNGNLTALSGAEFGKVNAGSYLLFGRGTVSSGVQNHVTGGQDGIYELLNLVANNKSILNGLENTPFINFLNAAKAERRGSTREIKNDLQSQKEIVNAIQTELFSAYGIDPDNLSVDSLSDLRLDIANVANQYANSNISDRDKQALNAIFKTIDTNLTNMIADIVDYSSKDFDSTENRDKNLKSYINTYIDPDYAAYSELLASMMQNNEHYDAENYFSGKLVDIDYDNYLKLLQEFLEQSESQLFQSYMNNLESYSWQDIEDSLPNKINDDLRQGIEDYYIKIAGFSSEYWESLDETSKSYVKKLGPKMQRLIARQSQLKDTQEGKALETMFDTIANFNGDVQAAVEAIVSNGDLQSIVGIHAVLKELKEAGYDSSSELYQNIQDVEDSLKINFTLEFANLAETATNQLEDLAKALSAAEKGLDLQEATKWANRFKDEAFEDIFDFKGGNYFFKDASYVEKYYTDKYSELQSDLRGRLPDAQQLAYGRAQIEGKNDFESAIYSSALYSTNRQLVEDFMASGRDHSWDAFVAYTEELVEQDNRITEYINDQTARTLIKAGQIGQAMQYLNLDYDVSAVLQMVEDGNFGAGLESFASALIEAVGETYDSLLGTVTEAIENEKQYIDVTNFKDFIDNSESLKEYVSELGGTYLLLSDEIMDFYQAIIDSNHASTKAVNEAWAALDGYNYDKEINKLNLKRSENGVSPEELARLYGIDGQQINDEWLKNNGWFRLTGSNEYARTRDLIMNRVDETAEENNAVLQDLFLETTSDVLEKLGKGIEGTLSYVDYDNLVKQYGSDIEALQTYDDGRGIQFTNLNELYVLIKSINPEAQQLQTILDKTGKEFKDVSSVLAEIKNLENQTTKEAEDRRAVLKDILRLRQEDAKNFDFMSADIGDFDKPITYWESADKAMQVLRESASSGYMALEDWIRIVNQINQLNPGADFATIGGELIKGADLMNAGINAVKTVDGKSTVVLKDVGVDILGAENSMSKNLETAIHQMAEDQIKMLKAQINIFEGLAAIEEMDASSNKRSTLSDILNERFKIDPAFLNQLDESEIDAFIDFLKNLTSSSEDAETALLELQKYLKDKYNIDLNIGYDITANGTDDLQQTVNDTEDAVKEVGQTVTNTLDDASDAAAKAVADLEEATKTSPGPQAITTDDGTQDTSEVPKTPDINPTLTNTNEAIEQIILALEDVIEKIDELTKNSEIYNKESQNLTRVLKEVSSSISYLKANISSLSGTAYNASSSVSNLSAGLSTLTVKITNILATLNNLSGITVTGNTAAKGKTATKAGGGAFRGSTTYFGDLPGGAKIPGAKAKGTLMGELGPELFVTNGHYYVAGRHGAEFVDLPDDAIVFNHLQTKNLLTNGTSGRGVPITNERNAVSFATGNVAMASARETANKLTEILHTWEQLLAMPMSDLGKKAGSGGGGGGGGSTSKAQLHDLERWYNLLRQIENAEKHITLEQAKRANMRNGHDIVKSMRNELTILQDQRRAYGDLASLQKSFYDERRQDLEASEYSKIFTYDEHGLQQYVDGENRGLDILAKLNETDANGAPINNAVDSKAQIEYLKSVGFDVDKLKINDDGTAAEDTDAMMQNFWNRAEGWRTEMDELYDSYHDAAVNFEKTAEEQRKLLQELVDNQLEVEDKLLNAIEERQQKAIDDLQDEHDKFADANQKYINGLNKALDREKQMYDDSENDKDLAQLQRRLAILMRSGGSAADIKSLQDEIDGKLKDSYFDQMQKQIDAVQEASDNQLEKLQTQIDIMTEQLAFQKENGLLWEEVYDMMNNWSEEEMLDFIKNNVSSYLSDSATKNEQNAQETLTQIQEWKEYQQTDFSDIEEHLEDGIPVHQAPEHTPNTSGTASSSSSSSGSSSSSSSSSSGSSSSSSSSSKTSSSSGTTNLANKTNEIKQLQIALTKLGAYQGSIDGIYGEGTKSAVKKLQQLLGLKEVDGLYGVQTANAARSDSRTKHKWVWPAGIYAAGGVNTVTGPAWLDGTPQKPEAVLNADDYKLLKSSIFSDSKYSLKSAITSVNDLVKNLARSNDGIANESVTIENVAINLDSGVISSDYDARRAGKTIKEELLAIARKTGNLTK